MSELTPITRVESYLDAIVNNGIPPTEDITRIETFLQAIYDNTVCQLTPITRIEMFLGKISGQDIVLPEPITRIELYLAAIAGEDVELPENPITRLEMYLAEWADSGDWTTISGAIVEFITQRAHKLKSCVVSLSPQQDLHGQDAPYPAGGGKNKVNYPDQSGERPTANLPYQNFIGLGFQIENGVTYTFSADITSSVEPFRLAVLRADSNTSPPTNELARTTMGNSGRRSVTFTGDANSDGKWLVFRIWYDSNTAFAYTVKNVMVELGSTATAFVPYSNICPISGYTGATVNRTGKNLFAKNWTSQTINGVTFTVNPDKTITVNGTATGGNAVYYLYTASDLGQLSFINGEQVALSGCPSNGSNQTYFIYSWHTKTGDTSVIDTGEGIAYTFKIGTDANITIQIVNGYTANNLVFKPMLELDSADTAYEEYRGNSYSVTWEEDAGTVYGGTVDVASGVLTIDRAYVEYDGSQDESWGEYGQPSDPTYCCVIYPSGKAVGYQKSKCNEFKNVNYAFGNSAYGIYSDHPNLINTYFRMPNANVNSKDEFMAWLANNPIQLVYELATPITIQLTPQQVTALKGYNAMWSNGGDIEVTVHGTPVEVETLQALNMLLGGAYRNNQTADDVSDDEALDIILGGDNK